MVFDGVQLVRGRVTALAWKLSLGVVRPRAARDVDVAPTEVAAAFEGWRGGGNAVDDDARREKVRVLKQAERKKRERADDCPPPRSGLLALLVWLWVWAEQVPVR